MHRAASTAQVERGAARFAGTRRKGAWAFLPTAPHPGRRNGPAGPFREPFAAISKGMGARQAGAIGNGASACFHPVPEMTLSGKRQSSTTLDFTVESAFSA